MYYTLMALQRNTDTENGSQIHACKKFHTKNRQFVRTPISYSTFKVVW